MKYTEEETTQLRKLYAEGVDPAQIGELADDDFGLLMQIEQDNASTKREGPSKLANTDFGLLMQIDQDNAY